MKKNLFIFIVCLFAVISNAFAAPAPKHEFRGVWAATVTNIDWPTDAAKGNVEKQKQELIDILNQLQAGNINAVCLQVRSLCDALYKSSYEPWSAALMGARGTDPGYDPLKFAIDEAHKRGMELHAWVNPFRVTSEKLKTGSTPYTALPSTDKLYTANTSLSGKIIEYHNTTNAGTKYGQVLDPGYPEVRQHIVKVLMEIVNNYDIDGLLMDDYFYPSVDAEIKNTYDSGSQEFYYDADAIEDFNENGSKLDDWHRQNVDKVIEELSKRMREKKPWVRFGMGPFGIWAHPEYKAHQKYGLEHPQGIIGANYYTDHGCNTVEWIKQGWVDYVNPQLYWPTTSTGQDYNVLYEWWSNVCEKLSNEFVNPLYANQKVQFYPSHAADRVYSDGHKWGVGEMRLQVDQNRSKMTNGYSGSVYYSARYYLNLNNYVGAQDSTLCQKLRASHYQTKALVPPMAWKSKEVLDAPNTLRISGNTLTWQHNSAERYTVYIYPKGIEMEEAMKESAYLQMVVYGKSFALPASFDVEKHNIAVCSYDRYGVEHSATEYEAPLPDVTYVLNGGILGKRGSVTYPEVPTNEELWEVFKAYYKTFYNENRSDQKMNMVSTFMTKGLKIMTDPSSEYKWLGDYILSVAAEQGIVVESTEGAWRYNVHHFFNCSDKGTYWDDALNKSVSYPNYKTAGKPENWGHYYQEANKTGTEVNLEPLPEKIVGSEFLLPRGKPDYEEITHPSGCNFLGWFDNPDMTGTPLTTLSVGYTGTVYAKWEGIITWMLNGGKYTGEGTLPTTVDADYTLPTAAEMARPAYVFGGWYDNADFTGDALTTISANYTGVLHAKWIPAYYVTWHPDHCHDVSNEDLWQQFMEDYNEWYYTKEGILSQPRADQPITNAIGFTFPPEEVRNNYSEYKNGMVMKFMEGDPKWQWLDEYINKVIDKENESLDSNAPLWTAFKEATGLTHLGALKNIDIVTICSTGALDKDDEKGNADGRNGGQILTELFKKAEWQWLKDYIKKEQNVQNTSHSSDISLTDDMTNRKWAFAVAAFFTQSQYATWPYSADFSNAGKHSVWKNSIPEEYHEMTHFHVTSELEYRKNLHAFFNQSNVVEYSTNLGISKTEGTADFTVKGQPKPNGDPAEGWYQPWWDATFPEYMADGSTLPKVARKGYVFAGWYCGTNEGYYFKPEARMNTVRGYDASNTNGKNHLWARWYELCLYEGYVKKDHHSLIEDEKVNHNVDMLSCANSDETKRSYKMSINRKFLADGVSYSTLVLPFAIPREVYNEETKSGKTAGDYIKLITDENGKYVFDPEKGGEMPSILVCEGANKKNVNGEDMVEFVFKELDVTSHSSSGVTEGAIPPYVPFLIKPKQPISARLQFWAAYCYSRGATPMPYVLPNSYVEFYPVLAPSKIEGPESGSSLILVDKNRLAQVYQDGEMLGLRGYFVVKDEWANLPAKITIRENVTTDVEEVVNTDTKVEVQKVMRNNRVYIIREGHTYDILGNKVE